MLFQFTLVVLYGGFAYQLLTLDPAFVYDDLVVLPQLDFVVLNRFVQRLVSTPAFFDVMDDLQQIDGNRKYLPSRLQNLPVLLFLTFYLPLQLQLVFSLRSRGFEKCLELGFSTVSLFG